MIELKDSGKVERIGYSGDSQDLDAAVLSGVLDDFMFTFNIIDQFNLKMMTSILEPAKVYLKIPFAQGIWRSVSIERQITSLNVVRLIFNKPPLPETWIDYKKRFKKFRAEMKSSDYPREFLKFALFAEGGKQFVVLGAKSINHIKSAIQFESEGAEGAHVAYYQSLWNEISQPTWSPHS